MIRWYVEHVRGRRVHTDHVADLGRAWRRRLRWPVCRHTCGCWRALRVGRTVYSWMVTP